MSKLSISSAIDIQKPQGVNVPTTPLKLPVLEKPKNKIDGLSLKAYHEKKQKESKIRKQKFKEEQEARKKKREQNKQDREVNKAAAKTTKNNTPKDQKPKGPGKLTPIINNLTKKLPKRIIPILTAMTLKFISDDLNKCPSAESTQNSINELNNIIKDLNFTAKQINDFSKKMDPIVVGINVTLDIVKIIKKTTPILSAAAKPIPIIPGAIVVAIDDLDYLANFLLFKEDGSERIGPIHSIIYSLTNFFIPLINDVA